MPLMQPFHNHPGTKPTHHVPAWVASRYRSSSATTSNIQHLNLATLSTDEGQGEAKIPTDDGDFDTKGSSSGDTSIDKRQTRTTKGNGKRRPPPNKRTSLKWVVESVETCLRNEKGYLSEYSSHLEDKGDSPCDWKEQDLRLVDALWELCWGELSLNSIQCLETLVALLDFIYKSSSAYCSFLPIFFNLYTNSTAKTPRDIADAGTKLESLNIAQTTSVDVQERIMKATAQGGLLSLSMRLLENILNESAVIPSHMAYTALLNGLRRSGRVQDMESLLNKLTEAYQSNSDDTSENGGIDIIAFNTYVAALCDAAVEAYETSRPRRLQSTVPESQRQMADADSRSLSDFLSDAVNLLESGVAKERFCLKSDPDLVPYNTILACAARIKQSSIADQVLKLMQRNGFEGDIYTYNARLRLATTTGDNTNTDDNEALILVEEIMSSPNIRPDVYTIDLALVPLVRAGKLGKVLELLTQFESLEATNRVDRDRYIDALGCFLTTLVKANELEFARTLFDSYVLPLIPEEPSNPADSLPQIIDPESEPVPIGKIKTAESRRLAAFTVHFNTMIEGYRRFNSYLAEHSTDGDIIDENSTSNILANGRKKSVDPRQSAFDLFNMMISRGICPDAYTVTSMAGLQKDSVGLSKLWVRSVTEFQVRMTPIIYNAFITSYGKVGDPSSAAWAFYKFLSIQSQGGRRKSWNIFLGSLSNGSRKRGADKLDVFSSVAALGLERVLDEPGTRGGTKSDSARKATDIMSQIKGMDCAQAGRYILDQMTASKEYPSPDSQSYCLVATAMFHVGTSPDNAIQLFRDALASGAAPDGRLVNACIRCYGDQVDKALLAWKNEMRSAVLAHENRKKPKSSESFPKKRKKNLVAAYNGLLYVCGKAGRPDIALRLAYAMNKEGVEPNETSFNSYIKGKEDRTEKETAIMRILANQHESLLQVECVKYDTRDKRRENEKRIRIIL